VGVYQDYLERLLPPWLANKPRAVAWLRALVTPLDTEAGRLSEAAQAGRLDATPADALSRAGDDRRLPRYAVETDSGYRDRLKRAFPLWERSGTPSGLIDALETALPGHSWALFEYRDDPAADLWVDTGWGASFWSQFTVRVRSELWEPWLVGDVPTGSGFVVGAAGLTVGSTATLAEVAQARRVVLDWKGAHTRCVGVELDLQPSGEVAFWPLQVP
jgi:hypothetical protein